MCPSLAQFSTTTDSETAARTTPAEVVRRGARGEAVLNKGNSKLTKISKQLLKEDYKIPAFRINPVDDSDSKQSLKTNRVSVVSLDSAKESSTPR